LLFIVSCPPTNRLDQSEQRRLPDAVDLRQMCIITKTDLSRIYDNLDRRQRDKDVVRQEIERKKEMADRSAQVTKHWPNTIIVNSLNDPQHSFDFISMLRVHENVNLS
jgi:hypothetical protein